MGLGIFICKHRRFCKEISTGTDAGTIVLRMRKYFDLNKNYKRKESKRQIKLIKNQK